MKKMIFLIGLVAIIAGCNSSDKKTDETKTDSEVGVQNANGNIPDTTNAIKLSTDKSDSSSLGKDSVR